MAISFDKALGIHDDAMLLRSQRAEVIANNIANADTPNYQARDIDFKSVLSGISSDPKLQVAKTDGGHASGFLNPDMAADLMYRIPSQASVDGNTVEVQEEMASYTENALAFQSSFTFVDKKFKGLMAAIKGE
ncbi:flagellar basal body rod protein FlgB [Pontibacterium sp. N1Y112]|uniref:Flagellar basal body rod protein FlgB n=1 Tax=Pontibacterium sinense TaxID=2781979 RepID=A0A8J7FHU2_9GAMM|nr:flagellar basal body rod protein FlgB [Pontibacterium sinense]MBE9396358.1 flagellar basal body rod protein FlgB [Pontibacterium sinense]